MHFTASNFAFLNGFVDESATTATTSMDDHRQHLSYDQFLAHRARKEIDRQGHFTTTSSKHKKNKQPVSVSITSCTVCKSVNSKA